MTQHLLKKSFLRGVLFLLLCAVGLGNAWGEKYKLITSTSELVAGEKYIIASMKDGNGYVMKNYESGNNWRSVEATASSSTITYAEGMAQLTLGGTDGKWTFNNGTYYIDATSTTSSNYLKGSKDIDEYNKFSISFSNKAAVITCTGKDSRNILRYNSTSDLFACYSSGQFPVYLYKKIDEPEQTKIVTSLSISETPSNTTYYVGEEPSAKGLVVTATYSDNSTADVTSSVSWSYEPATIASDTKSVTATASYGGKEASTTYNITVKSIANTAESAYTVAQACTLIDAGKGLSEEVYVKGIVSQVDSYNTTYGSITYWISDDGTTTSQQFQCYGGLDLNGAQFSTIDDLKLGTILIIKGFLKKYNDIYEFDKNNVIISKDESNTKTLSSIEISGTPSKTTYYVDDTPSAEGLTVWAVYSDDSKANVTNDVKWTFDPETLTEEGSVKVTATAKYGEDQVEIVFDVTVAAAPIEYTYTLDLTTKTFSSATNSSVKWNTVVANITLSKGSSSTTANNYIGGSTNNNNQCTHTRIYKNQILTISPKAKLIKVVFTATSNDYANNVLYYENAIATVDGVYINVFPEDGNCDIKITPGEATRFTQMVIHYQPTTVEISSAGLATFCLPYNATIPDGLTAYTAIDNSTSITLTAKKGNTIAAGEGVVLKGKEGSYTFVATENAVATEGNQMVGVTEDTELTEADNAYMLTRKIDDGSIAFRLLKTDYTLGANKAYLKASNTANIRELIPALWDDNATGIDNIAKDEATATGAIYNLAGQKLMRAQKGINIINGKLVIK